MARDSVKTAGLPGADFTRPRFERALSFQNFVGWGKYNESLFIEYWQVGTPKIQPP
jgi:hypothetical protein